eukprot:70663-Rhodomonas_salina.1
MSGTDVAYGGQKVSGAAYAMPLETLVQACVVLRFISRRITLRARYCSPIYCTMLPVRCYAGARRCPVLRCANVRCAVPEHDQKHPRYRRRTSTVRPADRRFLAFDFAVSMAPRDSVPCPVLIAGSP